MVHTKHRHTASNKSGQTAKDAEMTATSFFFEGEDARPAQRGYGAPTALAHVLGSHQWWAG